MKIRATGILIEDGKILLVKQKVNPDREWSLPGGKVEVGESLEQALVREIKEETGLTILDPTEMGCIDFYFGENTEPNWVVYIFRVTDFTGELQPNDEGELRWWKIDEIPYDQMWQDDIHWLPRLIDGKKFSGAFWFNEEGTELVRFELKTD